MDPKKILIIENDSMTVAILKALFRNENYSLTFVENGIDGLTLLPKLQPDLVITRLLTQLKSGFEIIDHVKKNHPKTAVIALSFLGEEEKSVVEAFQLGVDDFITKPFYPEELLMRVKRLLK